MKQDVDAVDVILATLMVLGMCGAILAGAGPPSWAMIVALGLTALAQPLLALVHELGHAWALVALTGGHARIQIGSDAPDLFVSIGRIDISYETSGVQAHCRSSISGVSHGRLALIALAGPFASGFSGLLLGALALALHGGPELLFLLAVITAAESLLLAVVNLIPIGALTSDGWLALTSLRRRPWPTDEEDAVVG